MELRKYFPEALGWIAELEEAVADAERALLICDWDKLDAANSVQPRLIHGLRNALERERIAAGEAEKREICERVDCIVNVRASQIERIKTFRDEVRQRLIELSRFRKVARDASAQHTATSTFNVTR